MVILKCNCKEIDINVRHSVSLTENDRHKMAVLRHLLRRLNASRAENIANHDLVGAEIVTGYIVVALARYDAVATVDVAHPVQYIGERFHFNHASIQVGMIAATYRFKDMTQLRLLKEGLQIPDYMRIPADRSVYGGEELLLIVLERCALGSRLLDLQNKYHRNHASLGKAIKYFCEWMQAHWGYLLHDHLEF